MNESILERTLKGVQPPRLGNPSNHADLLYNFNHWRAAWAPYITDAVSKPFQSLGDISKSDYKMAAVMGFLLSINDNGHPYSASIKTGLGLTDPEYNSLVISLALVRNKLKLSRSQPASKSLTRNLNDRIRQIGR